MTDATLDRLIDSRELRRRIPISEPTQNRWIKSGRLPRPRVIGGKYFWRESDINALISGEPERAA